jgi:RHS repeat-associated protein
VEIGEVIGLADRRFTYPAPTLTCDDIAQGLQYDPASQVTQILHQLTATSTQINQAAYLYNGVGNRTSLTDRRGPQTFGYDPLDRLTSASHPLLATPQAFAYDPVGNRTTGGSVVNAGNQLTADATHSYQYDDNGNLTRKTLLATGNFTQYTYDAENRLVKVEDFVADNPIPTATSTYRYDGLGRRIEKVANGQTTRYIYDGEDILLEYDGANVLQARYTHGPGIDEPIAVTRGGSTFFYHQDGLGTVTDLTDATGATVKSYSYDVYGTIVDQTGTVEQPYTYTGRELDSESGLYYYRARYYDSVVGRFLKKDPIGFKSGDTNLYRYVWGTPTRWIDPVGLEVSKWGRSADLPFPMNKLEHQWLKTDKYEAGMGGMDNLVPGQEGRSGLPFDPTQTVDHTGQAKAPGSHRIDIPFPIDEDCVNRFIRPGRQIGPWTPANQCQSFVSDVLEQCRRTPTYRPLGGVTSLPSAY